MSDFEFYETPDAFTRYLLRRVPIAGTVFEPCVGSGAIVRAADLAWVTNDIDPRWAADTHGDATQAATWALVDGAIDWTVTNPPFTPAIDILDHALRASRIGVAAHLRISIHEVLKTGPRRSWLREHPPTAILFLPRFAYQRSKTTGKWTTDSASACWVVWLTDPPAAQFIDYADEQVLNELAAETPAYRTRMDALMAGRAA